MYQQWIDALHVSTPSVAECRALGREGLECSRPPTKGGTNLWHPNCKISCTCKSQNMVDYPNFKFLTCVRWSWNRTSVESHPVVRGSHVEPAHDLCTCPNNLFSPMSGSAKVQTRSARRTETCQFVHDQHCKKNEVRTSITKLSCTKSAELSCGGYWQESSRERGQSA